jgi:calcineurin-like phosphoesterase family protein
MDSFKVINTNQEFFLCSDTHFSHKNIIKYCNRPFTNVKEMNIFLLKAWNEIIQKDDIVFFLGDFALGKIDKHKAIYDKLNGNKIFIRGNHDSKKNEVPFIKEEKVFINYKNKYKFVLQHRFDVNWKGRDEGVILLHGHEHNNKGENPISENNQAYNCCVEVNDYMPIHIEEVLSRLINVI